MVQLLGKFSHRLIWTSISKDEQSTLSLADTFGNWKKCPLVEPPAYESYSHLKRRENAKKGELKTVSVSRAVRLRECPLGES